MVKTLKVFGKGQVTLPKEWRTQFDTDQYVAVETSEGLLIKPLEPVVLFEHEQGAALDFPMGIDAQEVKKELHAANAKIS